MELLMQIDSCRQAMRMESNIDIKKNRLGTEELKGLISFDVKFKSNKNKDMGKASTLIDH